DRDPGPTPGSNTVRAKRAARAVLAFAYPWGRSPANEAESPVASTSACWLTVSSIWPSRTKSSSRVPTACAGLEWLSPGPSVQSHSSVTSGGSVPATSTARPPSLPRHSTGAVPARVTRSPGGSSSSTRAGSPMPSASLMRSSVAMLGLAAPCSMLTSILRLTPERPASWSKVQPRLFRPCRTRPPMARATVSAPARASRSDCLTYGSILHYRETGEPMTPDQPAAPAGLHPETAVICAGRPAHAGGGPLNVPVVLASNFHASEPAAPGTGEDSRAYSRTDATPTWEALEAAVGQVEGGHAVAFSSGMAAIAAVLDLLPA